MMMGRPLSKSDRMDAHWAYDMVTKGVKAVSILNTDLRCDDDEIEGILECVMNCVQTGDPCYLDTVRNPEMVGKEFTGGALVRPAIRAVRTGTGTWAVIFAATETMANLFEWAFERIGSDCSMTVDRAHAIIGLLCGYSPLAIESFLEQPLKAG